MSGSESLDPKEPGDPSPHELGVYSVVVCNTYGRCQNKFPYRCRATLVLRSDVFKKTV